MTEGPGAGTPAGPEPAGAARLRTGPGLLARRAAANGGRLFPEDLAAAAGIAVVSIHRLHSRSKRNRSRRKVLPGDLDKPRGHAQRGHGPPSPWWDLGQGEAWLARRPGRGRPRKTR